MWQQILVTALAAGILSAIWHGVKWLLAKSSRDEVMSGIQAGRKAFFDRFGTNSSLADQEMYKAVIGSQVDVAVIKAGVLEAEKQNRRRRRELGITGKEFDEVTVNNKVKELCGIANTYVDVPDYFELEQTWGDLQKQVLDPMFKCEYPDQDAIMEAYRKWRKCLTLFHDLIDSPRFSYILGALDVASQEFLIQACVRAGQVSDMPLQDAWIMVISGIKAQSLPTENIALWESLSLRWQ